MAAGGGGGGRLADFSSVSGVEFSLFGLNWTELRWSWLIAEACGWRLALHGPAAWLPRLRLRSRPQGSTQTKLASWRALSAQSASWWPSKVDAPLPSLAGAAADRGRGRDRRKPGGGSGNDERANRPPDTRVAGAISGARLRLAPGKRPIIYHLAQGADCSQ